MGADGVNQSSLLILRVPLRTVTSLILHCSLLRILCFRCDNARASAYRGIRRSRLECCLRIWKFSLKTNKRKQKTQKWFYHYTLSASHSWTALGRWQFFGRRDPLFHKFTFGTGQGWMTNGSVQWALIAVAVFVVVSAKKKMTILSDYVEDN